MKKIYIPGIFCLLLASCSDNVVSDPETIAFPDSNVSFRGHVQPYLNLSCVASGCHNSATQAGNTVLEGYNDLFYSLNPVLSLDPKVRPENEKLIMIIERRLAHLDAYFMVRTSDAQKRGLRRWVEEGKKNN